MLYLYVNICILLFISYEGFLQKIYGDIGLAKYCHIASFLLPNAMRN